MFMKRTLHLTLLVVACVCTHIVSCKRGSENERSAEGSVAPLKFKTVKCIDKQGIGIEAFRVLIPTDWTFTGGVRWILDNPGMPAVAGFRIASATGRDELEVFPNQSFFWTTNGLTLRVCPVGTKYFGAEVRQPVSPISALKNIVLPRFRRECRNVRVVGEKRLPALANSSHNERRQQGVSVSAEGASIRIEYSEGRRAREEEICAVVESFSFPVQSMLGTQSNTMWNVSYIISFRSDKGHLDEQASLYQSIVSSFRINPQWFSRYNQVVEYLIRQQIRRISNVGELSRIISRTHNDVSDMMMETYNDRQKVYDRLSENFSQSIRGVDEYYSPVDERGVELPAGHNEGWVNGLGEYILSDDPNYDPNVNSNQHWQRMEKK
jgi:hypothetical protein